MAVYKIFPTKDATIYSLYPLSKSTNTPSISQKMVYLGLIASYKSINVGVFFRSKEVLAWI